jgi:hypothetical protein
VSRTVKDLVAGSGISFTDRGEHQLKGVPDSWQLYQVAAVESPLSNQIVGDLRELHVIDRIAGSAARRSPKLMARAFGARRDFRK